MRLPYCTIHTYCKSANALSHLLLHFSRFLIGVEGRGGGGGEVSYIPVTTTLLPPFFLFEVEYAPPGLEHLVAIVVADGTPDELRLL